MSNHGYHFVHAADVKDIKAEGRCLSLSIKKHPIALFFYNSKVYALDNRCPHMGFPLSKGTLKDGILTCHWHHARFDLHNGGTFDQWAGDVKSYPVQIRNNSEIWIGVPGTFESGSSTRTAAESNTTTNNEIMLDTGLKRNISLIIAKAIIGLSLPSNQNFYKSSMEDSGTDGLLYSFRKGLEFGTKYKQSGWGVGLTIHTCPVCGRLNNRSYGVFTLACNISPIVSWACKLRLFVSLCTILILVRTSLIVKR
jgi:nitrite reductase/ring-hydroxylating ferredoxin subunit